MVGFWRQVGSQVGAKLTPKSGKLGSQDEAKKSVKKQSRKSSQGFPRNPEGGAFMNPPDRRDRGKEGKVVDISSGTCARGAWPICYFWNASKRLHSLDRKVDS